MEDDARIGREALITEGCITRPRVFHTGTFLADTSLAGG